MIALNLPFSHCQKFFFLRDFGGVGWEVGERLKREWIYVYVQLIHVLKPTQQHKAIILQLRRREKLPTPVFWPGKFHGLYRPWGHKESDATERLSLSLFFFPIKNKF